MAELAPIEIEGGAPAPAPPPDAAQTAVQTEPGYVAMADAAGQVQSVPVANVGRAQGYGWRPATASEYRVARDGVAGTIGAGLSGAARGASFGISDALTVEAGRALEGEAGAERMRQALSNDIEDHPYATMAGEIGGSLLPLALGAPPVTAEAEGAGVLARAASRVAGAAPRLFAEGVAFGGAHQLTEDTLGNHELVAGKYAAAGLEGGLVNLLLGSVLHAGGGAITDKLAARGARAAVEGGGEGLGARLGDKIRATAEVQAAKGAMPSASLNAAELQKLGRTSEEQMVRMRQVGRTLLDDGITTPGATKGIQAQRLTAKIAESSDNLGALRKRFAESSVRPDAENIMKRITQEVVDVLAAKPFSTPEMRSLEPYLDDITSALGKKGKDGIAWGTTFEDLFSLRRELDKKLDPKLWQKVPGTAPAAFEELGRIRGIIESEYEAAADRAATELGEDIATKYKVEKARFSDLKTAERWAKKGAAREAQNRAISLTDTIMAGAGIASGHGALAVGGALANKAMRTYGNQAAAYALDRIAGLEILQRAQVAFDKRLYESTEAFFGKRPPPATKARRPAITPAERVALRNAAKNPSALIEHASDRVAELGIATDAPNVAASLVGMVVRAAQFGASKLPPEPRPMGATLGPAPEPRAVGRRQQEEIDRAISALDSDAILDDLAHRQLDRQQIEALKMVNPPLYMALRKSVRDYGQSLGEDLTRQDEMALSIVFDTPVSSYTRGATIRGFQAAFAQGAPSEDPAQAGGPEVKPIGSGRSKSAESLASPTDRAEAQGDL